MEAKCAEHMDRLIAKKEEMEAMCEQQRVSMEAERIIKLEEEEAERIIKLEEETELVTKNQLEVAETKQRLEEKAEHLMNEQGKK